MTIMVARVFFAILLLINSVFAAGNIMPEKGDVTKNIHVILDYSSSMSAKDLQNQLDQFFAIATQPGDEFNLAITVFAGNTFRLIPGDDCDISEEHERWMAMPSQNNIVAIQKWLENVRPFVTRHATRVTPPIIAALSEEIDDLTVIVISDCFFEDKTILYSGFEDAQKKRKDRAKLGFIDIESCADHLQEQEMDGEMYAVCRAKNWWLVNTGRCKEEDE